MRTIDFFCWNCHDIKLLQMGNVMIFLMIIKGQRMWCPHCSQTPRTAVTHCSPTDSLDTGGRNTGGFWEMRACSTAANQWHLWESVQTCGVFCSLSFWDLFQLNGCQCSQYYWLSEPTVALANQLCLTLSSVCFEVVLAEGGTAMAKKATFSPSHCWALHFLMLETDQKRGGVASSPKVFCKTALLPPSGQALCEDQLTSEVQQLLNTCQQNLQSPGRSMLMSSG